MKENQDTYDLLELIATLKMVKNPVHTDLSLAKSIYTLAIEMDTILTCIQSLTYEIDNIQKCLLALHVKNESS